jgi:hypothetical protein
VHVLTEYDREAGTGVCRACGPVALKYRNGSPRCGVGRNQQRGQTNRHTGRNKARDDANEAVRSLKLERGCVDCGYNKHPAALDFDHLPGTVKVMSIADMVGLGRPWTAILAEIEKCEVVCANCHRIRTVSRLLGQLHTEGESQRIGVGSPKPAKWGFNSLLPCDRQPERERGRANVIGST